MSFNLADIFNEPKKPFDSNIKNRKNNAKAYKTLIANIKSHDSSRYYIEDPLREHMAEVLESLNELYGEFIDWNRAEKLLRKSKVIYCQSNHPSNGVWTCFVNTTITGSIEYSGELLVKSNPDQFRIKCHTVHETAHYISQNTVARNVQTSPTFNFISSAGLHLYNKDSSLGHALDEGMTELISKSVINNINLKNGTNRSYLFSEEYFYHYKVAERLLQSMGNKLLEAYFAGNPVAAAKEFDIVMGEGSWKSLMKVLDDILKAKRSGMESPLLQFKANQIIEKYENRITKLKMNQPTETEKSKNINSKKSTMLSSLLNPFKNNKKTAY